MQAATGLFNGLRSLLGGAASPVQSPASQVQSPTTGAPELLDLLERRYRYARDAKADQLETWATCLAFYCSDQWRQWDTQQRRLVKINVRAHRILPVYNQLPGIIDVAAAKLSRSRQLPRARPDETNDPEDQQRAERATHALRAWWHHEDVDLAEHEANVTRILFGAAFPHLYWDPDRLAKVAVPDPMTGMVRAEYAPVGQLCVEVLSPFDVFPEPCETWRHVSWVIIARRHPVSWFEDRFGEKVDPDRGDPDNAFSQLIPGTFGEGQSSAPDGDGQATLKILYEAPCRKYPQGRTVYGAGEKLLFSTDRLPLPFRGARTPLPVKMFAYRFVPKRLWPKGLIEECISPQRELNRGLGNLAETLRLHRGPKWLVPKEAKVGAKSITNAPDEVVEYSGVNPPTVVPPVQLPAWLRDYPNMQREELRAVAGQHDVSEGQVPAGVQAASAIQLLQQAENTRLSAPLLMSKSALEDLMGHALIVQTERYREPRMMAAPDRQGGMETGTVLGEELGPLEVIVEITEGAEDNDAVRQEQAAVWLPHLMDPGLYPIVLPLLRDIGLGWLADIAEQGGEALMLYQQQMQAQQMEMQAAAQPDPSQDPRLQQAEGDRDAKAQEGEASRRHEAREGDKDRRTKLQIEKLKAKKKP